MKRKFYAMEDEKKIWDIEQIEREEAEKEKLKNTLKGITKDEFTHINEGYLVRVHFSQEDYSATDALKHYLQHVMQAKYENDI